MKRKKVLLLATVFAMMSTVHVQASEVTAPTYEDADATKWTMGEAIDWNNMNRGVQGSNGWYCLYTTESNKNGAFDVTLMQEAKWGMTKSMWRFDNKYSFSWNVESSKNDGYWLMDGTGKIYPQAENGGISGAYAWKAPIDGTYTIAVDYVAGGWYEEVDGEKRFAEDGVTISVNTKSGALKKVDAPVVTEDNLTLSSGTMKSTASLKEGELFYVIVDPQQSSTYNQAEVKIAINLDKKSDAAVGDDDNNAGDSDSDEKEDNNSSDKKDDKDNKNDGNGSSSNKGDDKENSKGENKKDHNTESDTNKNPDTPQLPSVPLGQPNASAPSLNSSLPSNDSKSTKKEEKKEDSLLALSEEVGNEMNTQEEAAETEEAIETAEESVDVKKRSVSGTIWLLIGLAEVLGAGIILGAVRYYRNL